MSTQALAALAGHVSRLVRDHRRLTNRLSHDEELASRIEYDLVELEQQMAALGFPAPGAARPGGRRARARTVPRNRIPPEPRAQRLNIAQMPNGSASVSIDGGKSFELPPRLSLLLQLLTADRKPSDDELLGWWSLRELALYATGKLGMPVRKASVRQWVYRLRNALSAAGGDWRLLQTHPQRGVRFALKRDAPAE